MKTTAPLPQLRAQILRHEAERAEAEAQLAKIKAEQAARAAEQRRAQHR